jgi:hypothetical protein
MIPAALLAGVVLFNATGDAPPATGCTAAGMTLYWRIESAVLESGNGDYFPPGANGAPALTRLALSSAEGDATLGILGLVSTQASNKQTAEFVVANNDLVNGCTGSVAFWFRWSAGAWNNLGGMWLFRLDSASGDRIDIRGIAGAGDVGKFELLSRRASQAVPYPTTGPSSSAIAADTWTYVRAAWDCSQPSGSDILRLWFGETLVAENAAATMPAWLAASPNKMTFGNNNTYKWVGTIAYDQAIVWSTATEPPFECSALENYPAP